MAMKLAILASLLAMSLAVERRFPDDLMFGVATASYQIEGAWNEDNKGENIWDKLVHDTPHLIRDRSTGDVACDSYHKLDVDLELMKSLGVQFYRFSLSWARLFPNGLASEPNQAGVKYYNSVIDGLLAYNITPMVTLYHWDLPQWLQTIGGWPNRAMVEHFVDYARFAFATFGDRVQYWITFNELIEVCSPGYGDGSKAPSITGSGLADYACGHHLLLAHAYSYKAYQEEFQQKQKGQIGLAINSRWYVPKTNTTADIDATERAIQMDFGWYAHPIFSEQGDYPPLMRKLVDEMSAKQKLKKSRLPVFTPEEIKLMRGSADFFGLNHYTTVLISDKPGTTWPISRNSDLAVEQSFDDSWPRSGAEWLRVVPWGFRSLLKWIKDNYNNPTIIITENGYGDNGEVDDVGRVGYYRGYLSEMQKAIELDGCKVAAYAAWSLMDNFEWRDGYTVRFGLHRVDFEDVNRTRTPKSSAAFYRDVIRTRVIDDGEPSATGV